MGVDDVIYFQGIENNTGSYDKELWAYNTQNNSAWLAADINPYSYQTSTGSGEPGKHFMVRIGNEIYFDATGTYNQPASNDVWGYSTVNKSAWLAYDVLPYTSSNVNSALPGRELAYAIGDKLYFDTSYSSNYDYQGLFVYDTSTHEGWKNDHVREIQVVVGNSGQSMVDGDNLLFTGLLSHSQNNPCSATGSGQIFFIHTQSNNSTSL